MGYLLSKYVYAFDACAVVPVGLQVPSGDVWLELADFLLIETLGCEFGLFARHHFHLRTFKSQAKYSSY